MFFCKNYSELRTALWTLQPGHRDISRFDLFFLNGAILAEKEDGAEGAQPPPAPRCPPAESQNVTQPSGYNGVINC